MTENHAPERSKWLILALLASAQFVVVLDASIVNVALPSIGTDLEIEEESWSWIINAYVLTFGGFLLLGGRLADLLGRKRLFIVGLIVFAISSLVGGFATNETQLVVARAVQGFGAALLSPAALSIVTVTFTEGAERNKALGVWGAVAGSGGAAGVLLGGVLTEGPGWEWVLWVNFPVGLLAAYFAWSWLSESTAEAEDRTFDALGAVTVTGGLSILVYALVDAESAGWASTQTISLIAVSIGILIAFVGFEMRSSAPLVPFRIFRIRTLTGANITGILLGAALFSMFYVISLYMQRGLGFEPLKAGLSYMPLSIAIIVSAGVASNLVTKVGFKPILMAGLGLLVLGLLWFSQITPKSDGGTWAKDILGPSLLAAVGLGFSFVTVTIAAVHGVSDQDSGLASGLINTVQQVGAALGVAILAAVATSRTNDVVAEAARPGAPTPDALVEGYQSAFMAGAGLALLGLIACMVFVSREASRATIGADVAPVAA